MSVPIYNPSNKVVAAHNIPHLIPASNGELRLLHDPSFNILSSDYLVSILPLPALIAGTGFVVVFAFLIGILLRLLLLTCKLFVRRCVPGAQRCNLCCLCCTKGCTHPDSRCSKCCCCYKQVTAISRERRATTTVSTKITRHNHRRICIIEIHSVILTLLLVSAGMTFFGQQEISNALAHIARAMTIARSLFTGVADASSAVLLDIEAVTNSLVTAPCSPWVPQPEQDAVLQNTAKLRTASDNIAGFAAPIVAKLTLLSIFVRDTVDPTVTAVCLLFFLLLVLIVFSYAVGECYESRLMMRASLALSTLIVIALTAACCLTMVLVTILGDFCMAPAANTLSLIGDHTSVLYKELDYYTTCSGTNPNPFKLDIDTSILQSNLLNSTLNLISGYVTVDHSCSSSLFSRSNNLAQSVNKIQQLTDCLEVNKFWNEAINEGLCTDGLAGLFDIWVTFFCSSGLLFFGMVFAYAFYTWFLRLDVIGTGWFKDEDIEATEEYKYQMMNIDLHGQHFGFGALDGQEPEPKQEQEQEQEQEHEQEPVTAQPGQIELTFDVEGIQYHVEAVRL